MSYYDLKLAHFGAPSLALEIASELGKQIVGNQYRPGDLIEDEAALSKKYHVSRSVIRDAVKILVGKGLLEVRRGIGTRVQPKSLWALLDNDVLAWGQSDPDGASRLFKLLELRQSIEPPAAALAARHGNQQAISEIGHWVDQMDREQIGSEAFIKADAQFHRSILRATENEFFVALEGIILSALVSSIRLTNSPPERGRHTVKLHSDVYRYIREGDAEQASRAMVIALDDTEANLLRCIALRTHAGVVGETGENVPETG